MSEYEMQKNPWEHLKTGRIYRVLCLGMLEADKTEMVIYQAVSSVFNPIWIRPKIEFLDGRFRQLISKEEVSHGTG